MGDVKLTIKQNLFCKHYIENKGNATKAYMKAFGTKKYDTAKVEASKLLTNPNILQKTRIIMYEEGFNDVFVDLELKKMIIQDKYPAAKLKAISEYNKINRRYDESVNIINNIHPEIILPDYSKMTARELDAERKRLLS